MFPLGWSMMQPLPSIKSYIQASSSLLSIGDLRHLLEESLKSAQGQPTSFSDADRSLLQKLMRFPAQQIFPVLDICRMIALDSRGQDVLSPLLVEPHSGHIGEQTKASSSLTFFASSLSLFLQRGALTGNRMVFTSFVLCAPVSR